MSTDPYLSPESSGVSSGEAKSIGCLWPSLIIGGTLLILFLLLLPATRRAGPAAYRTQCKNNLKQIGLALHNYHDVYGTFPPAYTVDTNGTRLHSWRTLILPFMEQKELFDSIDLTKPWNDPVNSQAYETKQNWLSCPSSNIPDTHTTYMGLVGSDHFFAGTELRKMRDITGGTSHAIAVTEVPIDQAVHWMDPTDNGVKFFADINEDHEVAHTGGVQSLLADGSVRFLSLRIATETVEDLISISESVAGEF